MHYLSKPPTNCLGSCFYGFLKVRNNFVNVLSVCLDVYVLSKYSISVFAAHISGLSLRIGISSLRHHILGHDVFKISVIIRFGRVVL